MKIVTRLQPVNPELALTSQGLFCSTTTFFSTPSCSTRWSLSVICIAESAMAVCCNGNAGIYNATAARLSNSEACRLQQECDAQTNTCSTSGLKRSCFVYSAWPFSEETLKCDWLRHGLRARTVSAPLTAALEDRWISKAVLCLPMHATTAALPRRCNHTKWHNQNSPENRIRM